MCTFILRLFVKCRLVLKWLLNRKVELSPPLLILARVKIVILIFILRQGSIDLLVNLHISIGENDRSRPSVAPLLL